MRQIQILRALALAGVVLGSAALAHAAPAVAKCSNAQINQAYTAMTMVPNGSGATGDCNPNNYGAGSWSSLNDLEIRIQHAHDCSNPWLGQIYWNLYNRRPTSAECNFSYGASSSYMDLTSKVQAHMRAPAAPAAPALAANQYLVDPRGNLVDNHGTVVAVAGSYLIGASGSTLIHQDGAGLITPQPGMLIGHDGASLATERSVMSNGKRVITGTVIKR